MYLQTPNKREAARQFHLHYRPARKYTGYKPGWVPGPASNAPPAAGKLGVSVPVDPELLSLVEAWPKLPEANACVHRRLGEALSR